MRLKGTSAGAELFPEQNYMRVVDEAASSRFFRCEECLDAQQLKALMSQPRKKLLARYNALLHSEAEGPNKRALDTANKSRLLELASEHGLAVAVGQKNTVHFLRTQLFDFSRAQHAAGNPVLF